MLYFNDWCTLHYYPKEIKIESHVTQDDIVRITNTDISSIKQNAVNQSIEYVGNNPAICLSGGIDSQSVLSIFDKCNVPYTAVTFDFGNNLNARELVDAQSFATLYNIPLKVIKLDIMRFLLRDLDEFSKKYKIISPQFAVHAYFLETIKLLGYSGAVLGGNGFIVEKLSMRFGLSDAQLLDIENYSKISKFNVIPSFLSADKDLCILLAMNTPLVAAENKMKLIFDPVDRVLVSDSIISEADRYASKIKSYQNLNCKLKPQTIKKTGFEEIKNFYNTQQCNVWAFEKDFRFPLRSRIPEYLIKTVVDNAVEKSIIAYSSKLDI